MANSPTFLAVLLSLSFLNCVNPAQAQQDKRLIFKPTRLLKAFRNGSEQARLAELALARNAVRDTTVGGALAEAIDLGLKRKRLQRSTLVAVGLFCSLHQPELTSRQNELSESSVTPVAIVAASTMSERKSPEAFEALTELTIRPEYTSSFGMRRAILDGIANYKEPRAVDFIIDAHDKHPGQLRYEATKHLMRLTGQNHGGHTDRWQDWWKANRDTFDFETAVALYNVKDIPWPHAVPHFFHVPIHAYRVLFVIDHSKSMLSTVDGVTRMRKVQLELQRLFKELRPETRFNVLGYNEELSLWAKGGVPATLQNRLDATRFAFSLIPENMTSFYDAVDLALNDGRNLELIVVLNDGRPTSGRVVNPSEIVRLLTEKNEFTQVSITALGIDLTDTERKFLKSLTANNFGELWEIR
jgi:hypothetical protein